MMLHNCILHLQELAEPSIRDAFQSCVEQGAHHIIVCPFILFPGRHWSQVGLHRILSYFSINWENDSLTYEDRKYAKKFKLHYYAGYSFLKCRGSEGTPRCVIQCNCTRWTT